MVLGLGELEPCSKRGGIIFFSPLCLGSLVGEGFRAKETACVWASVKIITGRGLAIIIVLRIMMPVLKQIRGH